MMANFGLEGLVTDEELITQHKKALIDNKQEMLQNKTRGHSRNHKAKTSGSKLNNKESVAKIVKGELEQPEAVKASSYSRKLCKKIEEDMKIQNYDL